MYLNLPTSLLSLVLVIVFNGFIGTAEGGAKKVEWHVGYDIAKPNQPRCGMKAPPLPGVFEPICNPSDKDHCCSPYGYCGSGPEFCDCDGCHNFRTDKGKNFGHNQRWYIEADGDLFRRCGAKSPLLLGKTAICNPEDPKYNCCSSYGYCGTGSDYCDCEFCSSYDFMIGHLH